MHNITRLLLLVILCAPIAAHAAEITKPEAIARYIKSNAPYGQGNYTTMVFNVYDAALWTDAKPWTMQKPFALSLLYHMHFTSDEIVERSIEEMQNEQPLSSSDKAAYARILGKIIPEVRSGDMITDVYKPTQGSIFYFNDKMIGKITDDALARRFLDIWLSEKTSAPRLRNKLLNRE